MRIAVAGTGHLGAALLHPLLASRHAVVAVLQNGRNVRGIRRVTDPLLCSVLTPSVTVTGTARRNGIPILWIDKLDDAGLAPLRKLEPDLIVVGGFAIIFKKSLLDLPRLGCLNAHSSLLPHHRGPNPFSAAILAGDAESGVTFHRMDEGIDTGPIAAQFAIPIAPDENAGTLYRKCCALTGAHVLEVIDEIEENGFQTTPQDPNEGGYDNKLTPEDLRIDWSDSAVAIERKIRACSPFELARFLFRGRIVYVSRSRIIERTTTKAPGTVLDTGLGVRVATGDGVIDLQVGMTRSPVPWIWPSPFSRPKPGDVLQ